MGNSQHAYNEWPLSAHQPNAIQMAFRWWADGGSLLAVYWENIIYV